jgi:AcrR family transcriptional regulator
MNDKGYELDNGENSSKYHNKGIDKKMKEAKDRLLEIAKERFERFGFKKTTMDEIAMDARVSKKTIYENFKNKEDLFAALFMKEALAARKYVLKELAKYTDPLEKIKEYLLISKKYFEKYPFMVKVLQDGEGLYAPFLNRKYQLEVEEGMLAILADMVNEAVKQKRCRKLNPRLTAYIIFKLFQSFTYARTAADIGSGGSKSDEMQELADFITQAIRTKG